MQRAFVAAVLAAIVAAHLAGPYLIYVALDTLAARIATRHQRRAKRPRGPRIARNNEHMSDEPDGWGYIDLGRDRVPTHCGGQALDLDLGEWECRHCDAVIHVRQIPGWHDHVARG